MRRFLTYLLVKIHVIQNSVRIVAGVALHARTLIAQPAVTLERPCAEPMPESGTLAEAAHCYCLLQPCKVADRARSRFL